MLPTMTASWLSAGWHVGDYGQGLQRYWIDDDKHAAIVGFADGSKDADLGNYAHYTTNDGYVLRGGKELAGKKVLCQQRWSGYHQWVGRNRRLYRGAPCSVTGQMKTALSIQRVLLTLVLDIGHMPIATEPFFVESSHLIVAFI